MNDFTKEELILMYEELSNSENTWPWEVFSGDTSVLNKLQSMIDNYCEHEFYLIGYGENMLAQCCKCQQISRVAKNDNQ